MNCPYETWRMVAVPIVIDGEIVDTDADHELWCVLKDYNCTRAPEECEVYQAEVNE